MKTRRAWLAAFAAAVVAVPLTTTSSLASWNDREWATGQIQTTTFDCGTQTGYTATAASRQIGGTLLGDALLSLDGTVGVNGAMTEIDANGLESDYRGTLDLDPGSVGTQTRAASLNVDVLADLAGLNLTLPQIGLPVDGIDTGAVAQYAQATTEGRATGATGLIADGGSGTIAIGEASGAEPPAPATLSLTEVLDDVAGGLGTIVGDTVTDLELQIGAVSALSQIDGCGLLRDTLWGSGPVDESAYVTRDYEIAGLDLTMDSPLVSGLVTGVNGVVTQTEALVNDLVEGILDPVLGVVNNLGSLPGLGLLNTLGVLTVDTATDVQVQTNIAESVQPLLEEVTSGSVTIRPLDGTIGVDIAQLLAGEDGLNGLAPNTELVGDDAALVVNALTADLTDALNAWTTQILSTIAEAVNSTTLSVSLDSTVTLAGLHILTIEFGTNGEQRLDQITASSFTSNVTLVNSLAVRLLLGSLFNIIEGTVETALTAAIGTIVSTVSSSLTTLTTTTIPGLAPTLNAVTTPLVTMIGSLLEGLLVDSVLSLGVNVQPDQPDPLPNSLPYAEATSTSTAEYHVTALRVGVLPGGSLPTLLDLATATAGPVSIPPPG